MKELRKNDYSIGWKKIEEVEKEITELEKSLNIFQKYIINSSLIDIKKIK